MSVQNPTRQERAAMWLFHDEYARSGSSCVDFWKNLSKSDKRLVDDMIAAILKATP